MDARTSEPSHGVRVADEQDTAQGGWVIANHADAIRDLIDDLGVSQREAARLLDIPERTFRHWCRGVECGVWVLYALHYLVDRRDRGKDP
jgi:DNA-binding transcriptional regulator YiaG